MISLKLSNLGHQFESRAVFSGLDFDFAGPGLAVTGPNGSGKTTLLRILAGLLTPTAGRADVLIDGKPVSRDRLRDVVGFAGADAHLYPELSARENLRFLASGRGLPHAESYVTQALDKVCLVDRADDPVNDLSSGLRRRACLAAAIVHDPSILLLDEPSTSLDENGIEMLHAIVREYSQQGMVVLATNDPTEADLAADRIELG